MGPFFAPNTLDYVYLDCITRKKVDLFIGSSIHRVIWPSSHRTIESLSDCGIYANKIVVLKQFNRSMARWLDD